MERTLRFLKLGSRYLAELLKIPDERPVASQEQKHRISYVEVDFLHNGIQQLSEHRNELVTRWISATLNQG
jgi:anthranilate phosphoribosyltransferase